MKAGRCSSNPNEAGEASHLEHIRGKRVHHLFVIHCPRTWLKPARSRYKEEDFPKPEQAHREAQAVLLHSELTEEQQTRVIATAIGGNREIITKNRFLLPPDPSRG
jgi:hypothetical protein